MLLPGEMNKQMGAPYVRAAPRNVCATSERCTESSGEKEGRRETEKKQLGIHTSISSRDRAVASRGVGY